MLRAGGIRLTRCDVVPEAGGRFVSDRLAGLTPEEWSRVKAILAGALDLPEAERAAFLGC